MMNLVLIYPLVMPTEKKAPVPMFAREFRRRQDKDDYVAEWKKIGHCHVKVKQMSLAEWKANQ